jgi:hypothetical protein
MINRCMLKIALCYANDYCFSIWCYIGKIWENYRDCCKKLNRISLRHLRNIAHFQIAFHSLSCIEISEALHLFKYYLQIPFHHENTL